VAEAEAIFTENKIRKNGSERYYSPVNNALLLWSNKEYEEARRLFWSAAEGDRRAAPSTLKKYLKLMESWSLDQKDISPPEWLSSEILRVQAELFERTADPFWLYRQGRTYLASGDRTTALGFFKRAYEKAPDHVFYKIPAGRFVENLKEVEN
jgi:tetratricopeptide (TPR) repeat protein